MRDLWDVFHPADTEDEDDLPATTDIEFDALVPEIPTIDKLPDVVDYSTRGPNDFVVSGPYNHTIGGQGRRFASLSSAFQWAVGKYGQKRVINIPQESDFRWALLIKSA